MADYTLTKESTLDIDQIIRHLLLTKSIKDLFNIECVEDVDNITLLKAQNKLLYHTILGLENRIKILEGKK